MALGSLAGVRLSLRGRQACRSMGPWLAEPKDFRILPYQNWVWDRRKEKNERECGAVGSYKPGRPQCGAEKSRVCGGQLLRKQTCLSFEMCK